MSRAVGAGVPPRPGGRASPTLRHRTPVAPTDLKERHGAEARSAPGSTDHQAGRLEAAKEYFRPDYVDHGPHGDERARDRRGHGPDASRAFVGRLSSVAGDARCPLVSDDRVPSWRRRGATKGW